MDFGAIEGVAKKGLNAIATQAGRDKIFVKIPPALPRENPLYSKTVSSPKSRVKCVFQPLVVS